MKQKFEQFANDSTTAFATGTAVNHATGTHNEFIALAVALVAPLLRDLVIKLFDLGVNKFKSRYGNGQ